MQTAQNAHHGGKWEDDTVVAELDWFSDLINLILDEVRFEDK